MTTLSPDSPAVQGHLTTLQGVISRLAANSANCKGWCITLVSAIFVVVADKQRPELLSAAAIPLLLFWYLDAYYLTLERHFRVGYSAFVQKLQAGPVQVADVFAFGPVGRGWQFTRDLARAAASASVATFYLSLVVLLGVVAAVSFRGRVGAAEAPVHSPTTASPPGRPARQ